MKHHQLSQHQNQKPASASQPTAVADSNKDGTEFTRSPDEVARRAYFSAVNQGSLSGHEVQRWLEAEAQSLAERNLTRVHGYHNRT
jgi:hypothetical protein